MGKNAPRDSTFPFSTLMCVSREAGVQSSGDKAEGCARGAHPARDNPQRAAKANGRESLEMER
jgi:hypothetical protein